MSHKDVANWKEVAVMMSLRCVLHAGAGLKGIYSIRWEHGWYLAGRCTRKIT